MTAAYVAVQDTTDDVRRLVAVDDLAERCLRREFWRDEIGVTLVQLDGADGHILPVRAYWDPDGQDPGIGVNPLHYEGTLWYMLPDVIASVVLSGQSPRVARALRLRPEGKQNGLRRVRLRGGTVIDPTDEHSDPFVQLVQERRRVEADDSLSEEERKRVGKFLKITANSTAYGVLARFDRRERPGTVDVFGPDDEPTEQDVEAVERPGPFCFPPVAATLTAAARLMLALLERAVTDAGGTYAFCDTDSLAIVAKPRRGPVPCATKDGDTIRALSRSDIDSIVARFDDLNPYDTSLVEHLWDAKHGSLDAPVMCYAISAKRYALYRKTDGGIDVIDAIDAHEESTSEIEASGVTDETALAAWSEHGLGMYVDPKDPDAPARDDKSRRIWMREAWEWILNNDPADVPEWASRPALTRFTVSSPSVAAWFAGFNRSVHFDERIRPGAFGLLGHPTGLLAGISPEFRPARTYESKPDRWLDGPWFDRKTGAEISVTTAGPNEPDTFAQSLARGDIRIQTLADVLARYRLHPEHKSLAPGGGWATEETHGLMLRRPSSSAPVLTDLTGKEGNKIIERLTGEVEDPKEYRTDYGARADRWQTVVLPVLERMRDALGTGGLSQRVGVHRRSMERVLKGSMTPHASSRVRYLDAAADWCSSAMADAGWVAGPRPVGVIWCYQRHVAPNHVGTCQVCGRPVRHRRALYCSEPCKKRAYRKRRARRAGVGRYEGPRPP